MNAPAPRVEPAATPAEAVIHGPLDEPRRATATRWAIIAALALVAYLLRAYHLDTSSDIFVDEVTYLRLGQSVAHHGRVYLYGEPFFLHPPAFFVLEGAVLRLLSPDGDLVEQIYAMRHINAVLAGVSAGAMLALGRSVAGWPAGLIAAAFFTLDPFVMRLNSRNYLETLAIAGILVGYAVLLPAVKGPRSEVGLPRSLVVGVAFGIALLTKDMTAFLSVVPMGVCCVLGWSIERRAALRVALWTGAVYGIYPIAIVFSGHTSDFVDQKFRGLARFTGQIQETGFNQEGGPSFSAAILSNLKAFAATYVLIAVGTAAVGLLAIFGADRAKLVAAWGGSAYAMMAYAVAAGTLEEQFFYFLVVPAMASTAGAIVLLRRGHLVEGFLGATRPARWGRRLLLSRAGRWAGRMGSVAVALFVVWTSYVWIDVRTTPDNGYERTLAYLDANVREGARIGVTTETAEFLLDRFRVTVVTSVEDIRVMDAEYVLVSDRLTDLGYSTIDESVLGWLTENGETVYSTTGPSFGTLSVIAIPDDG